MTDGQHFKSIQYLGHSAAYVALNDKVIAIDPWITTNPSTPENLKTPTRLDYILLTHGHSDHAGDAVRLAKEFGSTVVATYELAMIMIKNGVPESNVAPMNKGGTLELDNFQVSLTHAMHSSSYDSPNGTEYAGEACGVVIDDGKTRIYHAGDTALFSDMQLIKDSYAPEIALLPIGDRFTMGPVEAGKAAQLIGCKTAIPIHFATFPLLTGDPQIFSQECAKHEIEAKILAPGEIYTLK